MIDVQRGGVIWPRRAGACPSSFVAYGRGAVARSVLLQQVMQVLVAETRGNPRRLSGVRP